ncbi:hypothetical protein [Synoicihabitans lomoniglobus]|uniref:Heparin-sulfate lyase N-terminal domain-containing protein n=1 Tax=Synoicihabitans lomoniglobus TaxID=2909285 RepID=A0AAF0CS06_9BACT|nr:hypothetical protein [Opitutaceae bacterium LMO-M01]WED66971.1 hypothetical protein PXH66_08925 [Opitutaceae bacterium LMO-M01]
MHFPFPLTRKILAVAALVASGSVVAQPSFEGPPPTRDVVASVPVRRAQYLARAQEMIDWRISRYAEIGLDKMDMATIAMKLTRDEDIAACDARVIELMKEPGTGPFWMFPTAMVAFAGRDKLSVEAREAIHEAWRTTRQLRGDTENHWVMYHTALYLMAELYPDESAAGWANGLSSAENRTEARGWLLDWMKLTTTIGQGEYNPTHYLGEYAIPMLMLASYADDPAMRQRGTMMLDWLFAELATVTLDGMPRGPNSRTDDTSVVERWYALATYFSWQLFGNVPVGEGFRGWGWGNYFSVLAENYEVPEVIYRLALDRDADTLQHDRARSRRIWRYSDEHMRPIYKTQYLREDYAVGSTQGGISDPIQSHVWDVTWAVDDPRGVHNTMFSMHPHSSGRVMQMFFTTYPEPMPIGVTSEGKPSYDSPDKLLGCSPYEQVVQDLDAVIALYDIAPDARFPHVNGFFSKDLEDVTEDASGWIFARGGDTYLAYRPLAPYHWVPHVSYPNSRDPEKTEPTGGRVLTSPHVKNGTILQAASVSEFASFADFQAAINALPLSYSLADEPTVTFTNLRGHVMHAKFGATPSIGGQPVDYAGWKLFEGTHLNSELGSRVLTISHGRLRRVLDFNTLSITDSVTP